MGTQIKLPVKAKFPSIPHLPWTTAADGDLILKDSQNFVGLDVGVFEKLDGECTGMNCDDLWARSLEPYGRHPSRTWMRSLWSRIRHQIQPDWIIFGENVYAKHAIHYTELPSYFFVFAVVDARTMRVLPWPRTCEIAGYLDLPTVPMRLHTIWEAGLIMGAYTGKSAFGGVQEGYVVRNYSHFSLYDTGRHWAKYVREGHVQPDAAHWYQQPVVPNVLAG